MLTVHTLQLRSKEMTMLPMAYSEEGVQINEGRSVKTYSVMQRMLWEDQ